MKSAYQIIQRPVITEKGLAIKENQNTLVFQVTPHATKTEIKQAVQSIFKVKVHLRAHRDVSGKRTSAREVRGLSPGLEEGICTAALRREDAGVRAEFVKSQLSALSRQLSVKATV